MQKYLNRSKHQKTAAQGLATRSESIGCMLQAVEPEEPAEQGFAGRSREHRHLASYWEAWAIAAIYIAGVGNALMHLLQ